MIRFKQSMVFLAFILSVNLTAVTAFAGPLDNLKPGEWYEIPNSKLRTVVPSPVPPGVTGPGSVMIAWSGGAYDTTRDRLIVWGGGHGDYAGNELYTFDLNTLQWSRIWGPSPNSVIPDPPTGSGSETYGDGNPASRHTYGGLQYVPTVDKFFSYNGSLWSGSGATSTATWLFNFSTSAWERKSDILVPGLSQIVGAMSAYDPVSKHVFVTTPNMPLFEYDAATDTPTQRSNDVPNLDGSAAIDPVRRKFVMIGAGKVKVWDISGSGIVALQTITTTGDTTILNSGHPGLVYDPLLDKFVAWNGGADIYILDFNTRVWTRVSPASTNTVIPTQAPIQGTYGRFQYVPSKDIYLVVNSIDENVFAYKRNSTNRISIPLNTWVTVPLPGSGQAPWAQMKHMRLVHNPVNGRIYVLGGDYGGPVTGTQSGRNEVYSYSIVDNTWTQEQPYCRTDGGVQLEHPTEVGFAYDTQRNVVWAVPGFVWHNTPNEVCLSANYPTDPSTILFFDPSTKRWTDPQVPNTPIITIGVHKWIHYDPVTDTIIRLTTDGGAGTGSAVFDIKTATWNLKRDYGMNADFSFAWTAIDVQGRAIYANTGNNQGSTLYRYGIDTRAIANLGPIPGTGARKPVWDSVNKVLIWSGDETLYVYHPDTLQWETRVPTNPTAFSDAVSGLGRINHVVFDPHQNVIMMIGGLSEDEQNLIANPYIYLYRYGNGSNNPTSPPPPVASVPSAPTNLQIK